MLRHYMSLCILLVVTNKLRQRSVGTFQGINQKLSRKADLKLVLTLP